MSSTIIPAVTVSACRPSGLFYGMRSCEMPVPLPDDRNILKLGPPEHPGQPEITPAMVESVRQRIRAAGGILTVWAVLHEDVYETRSGDGFYLHAHGLELNSADAQKMANLARGDPDMVKWHLRSYRLGLESDLAVFTALWRPEEEFRIDDFVAILSEIPPGGTASKLLTGTGYRKDGPLLSLP
jgi:hypothetical protein